MSDESLTIQQVMDMSHDNAKAKGIWDYQYRKSDIEAMALIMTEVAECIELMRLKGYLAMNVWEDKKKCVIGPDSPINHDNGCVHKPEGLPIELADIIIRVCDFAAWKGIDLNKAIHTKMQYNATRPRMHDKTVT